jgi:hypothetical protein
MRTVDFPINEIILWLAVATLSMLVTSATLYLARRRWVRSKRRNGNNHFRTQLAYQRLGVALILTFGSLMLMGAGVESLQRRYQNGYLTDIIRDETGTVIIATRLTGWEAAFVQEFNVNLVIAFLILGVLAVPTALLWDFWRTNVLLGSEHTDDRGSFEGPEKGMIQ